MEYAEGEGHSDRIVLDVHWQ